MTRVSINPFTFAFMPGVAESKREHYSSQENLLKAINDTVRERNTMYGSAVVSLLSATKESLHSTVLTYPSRNIAGVVTLMAIGMLASRILKDGNNLSLPKKAFLNFQKVAYTALAAFASYQTIYAMSDTTFQPFSILGGISTVFAINAAYNAYSHTSIIHKVAIKEALILELLGSYGE